MTGDSVSPRNEKISVGHRNNLFKGAVFELKDFDYTDSKPSGNDKCTLRNSDPQSSEVLSTSDLISAVGYAWDCAKKPLSVLLPKTNSASKTDVIEGGGRLQYITDEGTFREANSANDQPFSIYLNSKENSAKLVNENRELSCRQPSYEFFSFWRIVLARSTVIEGCSVDNCLSSTGILANLGSIYGCTSEIALAKRKNEASSAKIEIKKTSNCYIDDCSTSTCNSFTGVISASKSEVEEPLNRLSTTRCSENDILHVPHTEDVSNLPLLSHGSENSVNESRNSLHEHREGIKLEKSESEVKFSLSEKEKPQYAFAKQEHAEVKFSLSEKEKPQYAFAKQEHAFAGAMAGIFVSLCLHPMDTIKTVIQSCPADQKALHTIGRSIITERGVSGLYRGISSNILSSAPISAVYTFTYESVKKSLLPMLPKEYHSLAHCAAGGCASIATSFIFTPSERIKQQMQVGSHYRNCWNALIQVVKNGGLPSLYTGWAAVLCRNVPHSIIKFYTYERLKQMMLPSNQSNAEANIVQTLVCGGLAGSTASLFTTPFDVVKTRLQTQIPGSTAQYNGVYNTLTEIGKREGLKGLYRGLTPRLVMYMIQGALFFASYESFKRLLSLEVSKSTFHHVHKEDNSTVLNSTVPVAA
ncbi:hypothetical protein ABFS82_01G073000 [Erythranthe guttata]|uniref:Uncharacterized protein n=1 Tax=Erythranthe guttata TaxID=4155 RepID=A0A022Q8F6_ERYGU|nr:PREDICTED: mitochondrial substrate carrier family protein C isoform X1 [Erythranthe guttata]XP_012854294.1 PREDICTED: mitochondrial substrate carrier family protein C isoform X1 [Erythranthe guttata]EYU23473.1 hypothetical protein MIMGU_mgv1a002748mg [Erythranthe guttata]|eukprot:XP_012854293.1 PREDICTED: mitochondrial substrate carrier family protein C isoform X1 [Erythranthe guttata]